MEIDDMFDDDEDRAQSSSSQMDVSTPCIRTASGSLIKENAMLTDTKIWALFKANCVAYPGNYEVTPGQALRIARAIESAVLADQAKQEPPPKENAMLTKSRIQEIWDAASGHIPGCERHIAYARAIEAEVAAFRLIAVEHANVTANEALRYQKTIRDLQAKVAELSERAITLGNWHKEAVLDRDALRAKIAEQVAEIERLQNGIIELSKK